MGDEAGSFVFIMNGRAAASRKTFPALRRYIVHLLYHDAPERSASFTAVPEAALRSSSQGAATSMEIWSVRVLLKSRSPFPCGGCWCSALWIQLVPPLSVVMPIGIRRYLSSVSKAVSCVLMSRTRSVKIVLFKKLRPLQCIYVRSALLHP